MRGIGEFYARLAETTLLVLGFWIGVAAFRAATLLRGPGRRAAHAVSVQLAVVAAMSLVALADDGRGLVWRVAFGVGAVAGALARVLLAPRERSPWPVVVAHSVSLVLFGCVLLTAVAARGFGRLGIPVEPLQAEAGLFALLVFVALNEAFWLLFGSDDD